MEREYIRLRVLRLLSPLATQITKAHVGTIIPTPYYNIGHKEHTARAAPTAAGHGLLYRGSALFCCLVRKKNVTDGAPPPGSNPVLY